MQNFEVKGHYIDWVWFVRNYLSKWETYSKCCECLVLRTMASRRISSLLSRSFSASSSATLFSRGKRTLNFCLLSSFGFVLVVVWFWYSMFCGLGSSSFLRFGVFLWCFWSDHSYITAVFGWPEKCNWTKMETNPIGSDFLF